MDYFVQNYGNSLTFDSIGCVHYEVSILKQWKKNPGSASERYHTALL